MPATAAAVSVKINRPNGVTCINILGLQWTHMLQRDSFIMDARNKLLDIILKMFTLACT